MRRTLLLFALAASLGAANQPELPPQLTLAQALNIALSNAINVRTAMTQLDQATGQYEQARSPLLPQIDIGAHQSYQTINLAGLGLAFPGAATGLIGPFASMDARVFLTQQILDIAKIRSSKSSKSREESSKLLVDNAHELVAVTVVTAYLEALRAKASRDALLSESKLAGDLYKLTRDRVDHGVSAELEANRSMQEVNSLEQRRQESEQSFVEAKLNLANLLQAHITDAFDVSDTAAYGDGKPPDRDATIKLALATRADYRSAQANVRAAELQLGSFKASRIPTVTLSFDDGQSGYTPAHNVNTYRLRGSIDIPVFTGGRIKGEIQEAQGALHEAQVALDQSQSQIQTDVLTAISGVEWALKEVETSTGNVSLSRQEVQLTVSRFTQGISDNSEVVDAQMRLSRANDARIQAEYMLGLARANLARATGEAEKTYRR